MRKLLVIWIFLFLASSVIASGRKSPTWRFRPEHDFRKEVRSKSVQPGTKEFFKEMFPPAPHRYNVLADPYEPNDTTTNAYPIAYGDTLDQGVIDPAGDVDYFKFTGTAGDTVTIDIDADILGSWLDSYIYLYDTDSVTVLTYNDDWHSLDSRILNYVLPSTGTFFIKVREYSHPALGGPDYFYHIWITDVPILFGAISGTVTDISNGLPIEDVYVNVFDATTHNYISYGWTDSTGYYIATQLPTGSYKVRTWNDQGYADLYYDNKLDWNSADIISVTAPETLNNINFSLYMGGKIKGYVSDGAKAPLEDIDVVVFSTTSGEIIHGEFTDSLGSYTITGLPTGWCKLLAYPSPWSDTTHAFEWYNNRDNWATADSIYVTAPETLTNVNFTLENCGFITGNVYEASKGPIQGADVLIWVYINDFYGWLNVFGFRDITSADGSYKLTNLRTGNYKVSAEKSGYQTKWYNDKPDSTTADLVPVTMPDTTSGIDFYLPATGVEEENLDSRYQMAGIRLMQNYPNPFATSTTITYTLPEVRRMKQEAPTTPP